MLLYPAGVPNLLQKSAVKKVKSYTLALIGNLAFFFHEEIPVLPPSEKPAQSNTEPPPKFRLNAFCSCLNSCQWFLKPSGQSKLDFFPHLTRRLISAPLSLTCAAVQIKV
ncbi:hypothetical protein AVEN_119185-1 [Araneus ventricosus]|uniref:Uncharacterized protein n=1 Tax=Araneus ventricosus TaxID=182803 RepID=A0A4Y2V2Q4_ARAVE|nr:hypothetical protein AVEN_78250-1 [Araneus ventricosus]GBO18813.1 hypothetical protein AVEN_119185-1 [Araneus ventricosus]